MGDDGEEEDDANDDMAGNQRQVYYGPGSVNVRDRTDRLHERRAGVGLGCLTRSLTLTLAHSHTHASQRGNAPWSFLLIRNHS